MSSFQLKNSSTLSLHMNGWPLFEPLAKWLTAIASLLHARIMYQSETSHSIASIPKLYTII